VVDANRLQSLAATDLLLNQLYTTNLELHHSNTVMSFALKFGKYCFEVLVELEKRRHELGLNALSARHKSELEECFNFALVRCDAMADRLSELRNRLAGQISVVRGVFFFSRFLFALDIPQPSTTFLESSYV
jgi:hypothetical protein